MNYSGTLASARTVAYMQKVYAIIAGMFLFSGLVGYAVLHIATNPPSGIQCILLFLGLIFAGAVAYTLREEAWLGGLALLLFMGIVGWFGGVLAIQHEVVIATCYFCLLVSFGAFWFWSLLSSEKLNFWFGALWCVVVTLAVLWCVRIAYPDAKVHLLPVAALVSIIAQIYLLCSSASLLQQRVSDSAMKGASEILFAQMGDALASIDGIEAVFQILSFFWWA